MAELRFPTPLLVDEVVLLRPWRADDVPGKLMAFNDPVIQQFSWSQTTAYTEADARDYFVEQDRARQAGDSLAVALAWPEDDCVVLGGAALYGVDLDQGRAGIGYWLAPAAQHRPEEAADLRSASRRSAPVRPSNGASPSRTSAPRVKKRT